jgi:DGQHR domain-containing protein
MDSYITLQCIEVTQPIGTFYIAAIDSSDLVAISYAEIRRREGREIEQYIGTQRDLSETRVKEIAQYVTNVDACFPTSVILAIKQKDANYDSKSGILKIRKDEKVAKIIDGQHRIAGLHNYSGPTFQPNVTIFIEMDIEDQAMVFATINLKQTKVNKSIAYDLYEYTKQRSPQKVAHNIAKLLNSREDSPLYHRIKILGRAEGLGPELITQSTFVDRLIKMISGTPLMAMKDKDDLKRKKPIQEIVGWRSGPLVFRGLFAAEEDAKIAKILWNYFKAVSVTWPKAWADTSKGAILARSTGFGALMRLVPELINYYDWRDKLVSIEAFIDALKSAKNEIPDSQFTTDNYKPGSSGEGALLRDLRANAIK